MGKKGFTPNGRFGLVMERVRQDRSLTWQQLADLAGINYVSLNGYVNGRHEAPLPVMEKIFAAFPELNLQSFFDDTAQLYHPEYNPETALSHFYSAFTAATLQMQQLTLNAQSLHKRLFPNSKALEQQQVKGE